MKSRHIDLPEPARSIWRDATTLVDALLRECKTLEYEHWYLGGGTALAADWGHRTSTDIDILIAPGLSMAALHGKGYERLSELIDATGGTRLDAPDQKLSVTYDNHGKIDIFSSGRQLPGHEEPIEIGGRATFRLSNAQIFAGKFRRAIDRRVAARDLFDICHAARIRDPGMQQALNTLTEPEVNRIKEFWESSRAKIEEEARERLSGIRKENWIDPEGLVEETVRTTEDHRYAQVVIRAGRDEATVRTITIGGEPNEYRSTGKQIERDFHARGVARHLMLHNVSARQVIHDAREAMKQSVEQTVAQTTRAEIPPLTNDSGGDGDDAPGEETRTRVKPGDEPPPPNPGPAPAQGAAAAKPERGRDGRNR